MTMRLLQRIALFSFVIALALPPMAAAQSAADTLQGEMPGMSWAGWHAQRRDGQSHGPETFGWG